MPSSAATPATAAPPLRPWATLIAAAALAAAAAALAGPAGLPPAAVLAALSAATVMAIACRPAAPRSTAVPGPARRLPAALASREALLPLGLAAGVLLAGLAAPAQIWEAAATAAPVLWLIFTFALLARNMARTGLFARLARITLRLTCSSQFALTAGLFLLSGILTCLTGNDAVILALTPAALEICRAHALTDARLPLLASFIAANSLSAATPFGSPTNLIVALGTAQGSAEYISLMAVPTLLAAAASLAVLAALRPRRRSQEPPSPPPPELVEQHQPTGPMLAQAALFAAAVGTYSAALALSWPIWAVSLPFLAAGLLSAARNGPGALSGTIPSLPWSIIPFALGFFTTAHAIARLNGPAAAARWLLSLPPHLGAPALIGATTLTANTLNDLPASALITALLAQQTIPTAQMELTLRAVLAGLNTGSCLTPAGTLAGLLWFQILEQNQGAPAMRLPSPADLLRHGTLHLAATTALLAAVLPAL